MDTYTHIHVMHTHKLIKMVTRGGNSTNGIDGVGGGKETLHSNLFETT